MEILVDAKSIFPMEKKTYLKIAHALTNIMLAPRTTITTAKYKREHIYPHNNQK